MANVRMPPDDLGLCGSCSRAQVMKDGRGRVSVACQYADRPVAVKEPISECSKYYKMNQTSLHEFESIAWIIRTDRKGKAMGFEPPVKDS